MGIELDVLVGHPEHDLLFVATQVARAAGLKNPYNVAFNYRKLRGNDGVEWVSIGALPECGRGVATDNHGRSLPANTSLLPEGHVYQMLLRGRSPASEPFRRWVTEEVLPTIRKTGKYDAEQSTDPIAMGVMDELRALKGIIESQGVQLCEQVKDNLTSAPRDHLGSKSRYLIAFL